MDAEQLDAETYQHLRALAGLIHSERARGNETIQPTALMHEAWAKVASGRYNSREHFMAVAARAMRQILVDRTRARMAEKRGGNWHKTTLQGVGGLDGSIDVLMLDEALNKLEAVDATAAKVAMMQTFGGMTGEEIARALDISPRSVWRSWRFARAYLARLLKDT